MHDRARRSFSLAVSLLAAVAVGACSSSGSSPDAGSGGTGGANGGTTGTTGGTTGTNGGTTGTTGGTGGTTPTGGTGGTTPTGGTGGTTPTGGTGGTPTGGTGGSGGTKTDGGVDAPADKPASDAATGDGGAMTFTTTSLKTVDGGLVFPPASSAPMNQSPAFMWSGAPAGTLSFAISMYDASAKNTHWILWDIDPALPPSLMANLPRGAMPTTPAGATQMSAFGGTAGYEGPGGGSVNNYEIELWALKVAKLAPGTMSLNTMHTTLLPTQKLESVKILAKGTRNGL